MRITTHKCDRCGAIVETDAERVTARLTAAAHVYVADLCNGCATRLVRESEVKFRKQGRPGGAAAKVRAVA